ncbi:MAG: hypothetical protein A4E28_00163 [Methanocella sp. PtaU1.Bin125]|nr:MAG: hypothetical protein A4E28_00163 [Methanocella sp. PtaU1.Bin125]
MAGAVSGNSQLYCWPGYTTTPGGRAICAAPKSAPSPPAAVPRHIPPVSLHAAVPVFRILTVALYRWPGAIVAGRLPDTGSEASVALTMYAFRHALPSPA